MRPSDAKLSKALHKANLTDLANRAAAGEFNEFFGPHATPELLLSELLREAGTASALAVRKRLINGDFDAGSDESEEWARSADGQNAMAQLIKGRTS